MPIAPRGIIRPIVPLEWTAGPCELRRALELAVKPWEDTPFMVGQCCPGIGVDCTHFVCAVLDRLYGNEPRKIRRWKPGTGITSIKAGATVLRHIVKMFPQAYRVREVLEPGDTVALRYGRGTNHVALIGWKPNTIWHCPMGIGGRVSQMPLMMFTGRIVRAYRMRDRAVWWRKPGTGGGHG